MDDLITSAMKFANLKHEGQVRKYTGLPYITHPMNVARLVKSAHGTDEMIAAAWLHDVVEDTDTTIDQISDMFGKDVAYFVNALTDKSRPEDGNRSVRKSIDRHHIAMFSSDAHTIKLADLIDNSESIQKYDPDFAKTYMNEKALLMPHLSSGNRMLWCMADMILMEYFDV